MDVAGPIADNGVWMEENAMSGTVIYHNPHCSKSRQTLELLETNGIEPEVVEYLKTPPDAATLSRLLELLRLQPRELIRTDEPEYRQLGLDDPSLPPYRLIAAMVSHPKLIQRPIVVTNGRAALGRPPEAVLELF